MSVGMLDFLLYTLLCIFVVYSLVSRGVLRKDAGEASSGRQKVDFERQEKKRKAVSKRMRLYSYVYHSLGVPLSNEARARWEYRILRLGRSNKYLLSFRELMGREVSVEELFGRYKLIKYIVVGAIALLYSFTSFGLLLVAGVVFLVVYIPTCASLYDSEIKKQDISLDSNLIDVYTLIHPRLTGSGKSAMKMVLDEFIRSDIALYGEDDSSRDVIRNFARDFISSIDLYGTSTQAITELRKRYKTALVVNMFSLLTQALSGVDNSARLMTFKISLEDKRVKDIEREEQRNRDKAKRAYFLVYFVLGELIVLSWVSKFADVFTRVGDL